MDTGYEIVIDPFSIVWTLSAVLIHVAMMAVQLGLVLFLIGIGLAALFLPQLDAPWAHRFGAMRAGAPNARIYGAARIGLGVALLLPLLFGAPFSVSVFASLSAMALSISLERGLPPGGVRYGRPARLAAMVAAALVAVFALFESEDGLALGADVLATAQRWRVHELEWQRANDVKAPKRGDLAPDFELQDPSGATAVRLSDFRGKRPVALVFGSYT